MWNEVSRYMICFYKETRLPLGQCGTVLWYTRVVPRLFRLQYKLFVCLYCLSDNTVCIAEDNTTSIQGTGSENSHHPAELRQSYPALWFFRKNSLRLHRSDSSESALGTTVSHLFRLTTFLKNIMEVVIFLWVIKSWKKNCDAVILKEMFVFLFIKEHFFRVESLTG